MGCSVGEDDDSAVPDVQLPTVESFNGAQGKEDGKTDRGGMSKNPDSNEDIFAEVLAKQKATDAKFDMVQRLSGHR